MNVRIVTDSTADIPEQLARELGITVVPIYILFGDVCYRDGLELSRDEFYHKLLHEPVHPGTSQPTPQDFVDVYNNVATQASGILSLHLSSILSGTYHSAVRATEANNYPCPIEVIDTRLLSIAFGLIVIKAARLAREGMGLAELSAAVRNMLDRIRLLVLFDTLKYLSRGGRIGKAKSLLGSVQNVKPLLTMRHGEFIPIGQVRNRKKGVEKLVDFITGLGPIEDMCILHSTTAKEARELAEKMDGSFPVENSLIARLGAGLAVHGGPGVLAVVGLLKEPAQ